MADGFWIEVLVIVLLMLGNGFFAASEIAVVSARKGRLEQQAQEGRRGSAAALQLADNPNRFLSTVQVGITVISTFAAAFGGASLADGLAAVLAQFPALAPYATSLALGLVVVAISYLSLIVGELVPKRLALQNAEGIASAVAPVMQFLARAAAPVVGFLTFSTDLVLRLLGRHNVPETPITEDDILALVREGAAEGTVEATEQALVTAVFALTERTVRSVMTPRTQMLALDVETPFATVLQTLRESGHSRVPVYESTIDTIVGVLYSRDLLAVWGQTDTVVLRDLLRPPRYVLESQRALTAFHQLKHQRSTIGIVLDEYGQVAGMITLEDIFEELVGEIDDEYDEASEAVVRRDDGSYLVDGLLPITDLHEHLPVPQVEELARDQGFATVAGLILALLGRLPVVGDVVRWQGYTFEVVDMDERRIDKALIRVPTPLANMQNTSALVASAMLLPPKDNDVDPTTTRERI